jgi:hypothetical protein
MGRWYVEKGKKRKAKNGKSKSGKWNSRGDQRSEAKRKN